MSDKTALKTLAALAVAGTALCILGVALTWTELREALK